MSFYLRIGPRAAPGRNVVARGAERLEPLCGAGVPRTDDDQDIRAAGDEHLEHIAEDEELSPYLQDPLSTVCDMNCVGLHRELRRSIVDLAKNRDPWSGETGLCGGRRARKV